MTLDDDLCAAVAGAIDGATDWLDARERADAVITQDRSEDGKALMYALGYMLVGPTSDERRERSGVFATAITWEDGSSFPPPLTDVEDDIVEQWAVWAEYLPTSLAQSRLHDLLWLRRYGERPDLRARAAADAYLRLVESGPSDMRQVEAIGRALELALEVGDAERAEHAIAYAITKIETELANTSERRPGIPLRLLRQLAQLRTTQRPTEIEGLLDRTMARYGDDPWIAQAVDDLRVSLTAGQDRVAIYREQVQRWRAEAEGQEPMLRLAYRQRALELAQTYGLREEVEAILGDIQASSNESLGGEAVSAQVELPSDEIDALIASFGEYDDVRAALRAFGAFGPPSGDAEDNLIAVRQMASDFPLQRLFRAQQLDENHNVVFQATTPEEHDRMDLSRHEAMQIQVMASILSRCLDTIQASYPDVSQAELTAIYTTPLIEHERATVFSDALRRHWQGDYQGAAHIAIAQIEAVIRAMVRNIGLVVIRPPEGRRPGQVIGMGACLDALNGRLDESWRRYLYNLFSDPLGINLRNRVSHGLLLRITPELSTLAIQASLFLTLVGPRESADGSDAPAAARSDDPPAG